MSILDGPQISRLRLAQEQSFQLGPLQVRPATREVVRNGLRETLEPRVMQVLVALAQADGRVIGRDELIERCWDGRIVGDDALHRVISKLRDLSDGVGTGAFEIVTISRVGYRLMRNDAASRADLTASPVTATPVSAGPGGLISPASGGTRPWGRRQAIVAGLGSVAALGAGAGLWTLGRNPVGRQVKSLMDQGDNALRLDSPDASARGVGFLEVAVALAPGDAAAWGRLALVRYHAAAYSPPDRVAATVADTQAAAQRALALDDRQSDALAALALLPPYYGEWRMAEDRMNSVLAIDPSHIATLDAHSFLLPSVGRAREGSTARLDYGRREPLHAGIQFRLIYAYWILGRVQEADRTAERASQLWPRHPGVWLARLFTLAFTGRADRALAHVLDVPGRPEAPPAYFATLEAAMLALVSGSARDRVKAVDGLIAQVSQNPSGSVIAVPVLNGLGEVDRAFDVAEAYLLERGPIIASLNWRPGQPSVNDQRRRKTNMLFIPVSAPMRADPRFQRLTEDIGLAAYWDEVGVTPDHQT